MPAPKSADLLLWSLIQRARTKFGDTIVNAVLAGYCSPPYPASRFGLKVVPQERREPLREHLKALLGIAQRDEEEITITAERLLWRAFIAHVRIMYNDSDEDDPEGYDEVYDLIKNSIETIEDE